MDKSELSLQEYADFACFLEKQSGIVLGGNKAYLVRSRLMPLVRETNCDTLSALISQVLSGRHHSLTARVVDAMTTNETLWFRDRYPFDILEKSLIPEFSQARSQLRIWCAACSSGQEPYSIAMLILEYKKAHPRAFPGGVQIIATDLSADMLARAAKGHYDALSISRGLPPKYRDSYFTSAEGANLQIRPEVKQLITFKPLNLFDSYASLGSFQIIFCRNVLIYFSAANKRKILQQIAACLQEKGILFLGASESLSELISQFDMVRCHPGLYYRKKI